MRELRRRSVEFRVTPAAYHDLLEERIGPIDAAVGALREQQILVNRDEAGYLLRIFTRLVQGRPTLFCKLIQQAGARLRLRQHQSAVRVDRARAAHVRDALARPAALRASTHRLSDADSQPS